MHWKTVSLATLLGLTFLLRSAAAQVAVGTEFIPPRTTAAILVKPNAIHQSPLLQMVPWEVLTVKSQEIIGMPLENIESIVVAATPPDATGTPTAGAIVKLTEATSLDALFPQWREAGKLTAATWPGTEKRYLKGDPYLMLDVFPVDEKTYLLGMPEAIQAMLTQKDNPQASPMATLIQNDSQPAELQAFLVTQPIRDLARFLLSDPRFDAFPGVRALPQQVEHAQFIADLDMEKGGFSFKFTAKDPSEAKELQKTLAQLLDLGVAFAKQMAQPPKTSEAEENAFRQYVQRVTSTLRTALEPTVEGSQVTLTTVGKPGTSPQVLIASGTAVLLPAIEAARLEAGRMGTSNNLKQIMLALHNYHDTYGELPRDIRDENGKPLLSWRVSILPFIEQAALYNQFHLNEPWDSEHNLKVAQAIPVQYLSPDSSHVLGPEHKTRYQMPLGEGFPGSAPAGPLEFRDFTDGLSNTIAVVEVPVEDAVLWTKPEDFQMNAAEMVESIAPGNIQGVNMARYDGSVMYEPKSELNEKRLKALFTHQGGEVVD